MKINSYSPSCTRQEKNAAGSPKRYIYNKFQNIRLYAQSVEILQECCFVLHFKVHNNKFTHLNDCIANKQNNRWNTVHITF